VKIRGPARHKPLKSIPRLMLHLIWSLSLYVKLIAWAGHPPAKPGKVCECESDQLKYRQNVFLLVVCYSAYIVR